jgi:iduronate 2-sulfatase
MESSIINRLILPVAVTAFTFSLNAQKKQMNVLFIAVDDMNNDLACFGNRLVKSPNIDRLAKNGVVFANAYCQFPLSSPSRTSLLTGLRPDSTKVFDLTYHFRQDLPDVITLPQMFMKNEYYVARVGKMFHYGNPGDIGTNGLDDKASWMERINPAGLDKTSLELDVINYTPEKKGLGAAMAYLSDKKGTDIQHTDGIVATETIKLLKGHKDKPFFIAAGFYKPHCPWITPSKYFDLYNMDQMKLPAIDSTTRHNYPELSLASTKPWPYLGINTMQARECKLAYYAAISFVDAQIGRLLDAIQTLGLDKNTIIVFWSDHGYQLGEHGLWFKQSLFEESSKCPLIISVPGSVGNGKTSHRIVELLDIYPTLAELAGLHPPKNIQGFSLVPLLKNPDTGWKHPAFTQVQRAGVPGHSIRNEQYRYTEWNFGKAGEELYDEVNDPQELHNLVKDPRHSEVLRQLKQMLHEIHPKTVSGGKAIPDARKLFSN